MISEPSLDHSTSQKLDLKINVDDARSNGRLNGQSAYLKYFLHVDSMSESQRTEWYIQGDRENVCGDGQTRPTEAQLMVQLQQEGG